MKAIVLGLGPSFLNNTHILKDIAKIEGEQYKIFVPDRMLPLLDTYGFNGMVTDIQTATTEQQDTRQAQKLFEDFYSHTKPENTQFIIVSLSCQVSEHLVNFVKSLGYIVDDYHRFPCDGQSCIRKIKSKDIIYDAGNVGGALLSLAYYRYGIKDIATFGIDLVFDPRDVSLNDYGFKWDGEAQQMVLLACQLYSKGVKIYNCNPPGIGRFKSPIKEGNLSSFLSGDYDNQTHIPQEGIFF